jgi:hydrogenase maturation protein HypF
MAEYRLAGPVIGLSYDGTGYGTDGNIWGSELLITGFDSFDRISHFEYVPLPGGDLAIKEPWRSALAYLYHTYAADWDKPAIPFLHRINCSVTQKLVEGIDKKINSPLCCSAGRLFDAVAALLTICTESDYHAQAPMLLENYIDPGCTGVYPFNSGEQISFLPTIRAIVNDIIEKKDNPVIITKFHNTIAQAAMEQIKSASDQTGIRKVVISGGTFQNKFLSEKLVTLLKGHSFEVFFPVEVPCNDGGIALGQIAVAAHKKS